MKLIILHGNGLIAISKRLSAIKKEFDPISIIEMNGQEKNAKEILINLLGPQLFSDKRLVVVEDFEDEIDLEKISRDQNLTLVLVFSKSLLATNKLLQQAKKFKAEILEFSEEKDRSIFPFLDLLAEKNPQVLTLLEALRAAYGSQYILTMIFYMLRRLIITPKNVPTFVTKKLASQKENFSLKQIQQTYLETINTDFRIKSGLVEEKIALNLLLIKLLS